MPGAEKQRRPRQRQRQPSQQPRWPRQSQRTRRWPRRRHWPGRRQRQPRQRRTWYTYLAAKAAASAATPRGNGSGADRDGDRHAATAAARPDGRWDKKRRTAPPLSRTSATRQSGRRRPTPPPLVVRATDSSNSRRSSPRRYAHGARRHRLQRAPSAHVGSVIHSATASGSRRHRTNQAQPSGNAERERGGKDGVVVGTAEAEPQHRAGAGKVSNDRRVMRKKVTTAGMATPRHGRGRNVGKGSWTAVGAATTRLAAARAGQHPRTGGEVGTAGAAASRQWVLRRQGRQWQHREKQHERRRGEQQRRRWQSQ